MRIDPHTHSLHSDGTQTPAELIADAAAAGIDVIGLTDHDSTAGWDEALSEAWALGIKLLRGAEVTASSNGYPVHMLTYLHDSNDLTLAELMADNRDLRPRRARAMVEALAVDYPITWEAVLAEVGDPATVGRPHIADALVAAGVFPHRDDAFAEALSNEGPYYVHLAAPGPVEVVRAIRGAGGVPVLAHPFVGVRGNLTEDEIAELAEAGLFGLEADHTDHTLAQAESGHRLAKRLGLQVTGSSDYHGAGKTNRLGDGLTSPDVLAAMLAEGAIGLS